MSFALTFFINAALFIAVQLLKPKPELENAKPLDLGDFSFPTATEGRIIPLLWGTQRIDGGNAVWHGDFIQEAITERVRVSFIKKEDRVKAWRYHIGVQMALCQGEVDNLRSIEIDETLVGDYRASPIAPGAAFSINAPNLYGGEDQGEGGVVGTMRFFNGSRPQLPSTYLATSKTRAATVADGGSGYLVGEILTEDGDGVASVRAQYRVVRISQIPTVGEIVEIAFVTGGSYTQQSSSPAATTSSGSGTGCTITLSFSGPFQAVGGVTPGYHDICYVVPDIDPLNIGTRQRMDPWRIELRRTAACNFLGLIGGDEEIDGGANPMNVIYEVMTNAQWGRGVPAADIDTTNFVAAATTLATERNGFSFLLDRAEDTSEMLERVVRQIDAVLFKNPFIGKWQIRLTRFDYDPNTVAEINASNLIDVPNWNGSTWEDTTNNVFVPFNDRDDDYKSTFGFAQDMAGTFILGETTVSHIRHPGVKVGRLANDIAFRDLRSLAIPFFQGTLVVTRALYGTLPGDVLALTDEDLGLVRLPIRVKDIDYGSLTDDKIILEVAQDIFFGARGSFGDSTNTDWSAPTDSHDPYPSDEQLAFEAPRAFTSRDADSPDPETDKVYATARKQSNEVSFLIAQRNAVGTPAGAFETAGESYGFIAIGQLSGSLSVGSAYPLTSFTLAPLPDSQTDLNAAWPLDNTDAEMGTELAGMILIGSEFMLVRSAQVSGPDVLLSNIYRGALDSVQQDHADGDLVYLMFLGGSISDASIPAGNNVDVKLLPRSVSDTLDEADATAISFQMDDRTRRPYPPASFRLNSIFMDATNVNLDGSGAGEDVGILVDQIVRRDFRTMNEVASLVSDAALLATDFPTLHSTTVEIEVRDGAAVLTSTTGLSGTSATMRQLDILAGLDTTTLPASLTMSVRQSHTLNGTVYKSRVYLSLTFTVDSEFVGKHAFGLLDNSDVSTIYEVQTGDDSTDHVFNLSTSFTVGDVEYRLDGGAWTTLIAAGGTGPGTIPNASLSVGTDIEVRHLSTDTAPQKLLSMTVGGTAEAYAVLIS